MPQHSLSQVIIYTPATLQREAWRALLDQQPFINVLVTACEVAVVASLVDSDQATAILVDLPDLQPDLIQQLQTTAPSAGLLILVDTYELDILLPLLQGGALGCLSRDATIPELACALIAVGRGEMSLPDTIVAKALTALARGNYTNTPLHDALTDRETEVLHLLAEGLTNKDMAQTFVISVRAVEAHLRNIYDKLNVDSRTEAALWAVRHGYASAT